MVSWQVGRMTWALSLSLLLLMKYCHAVQNLHSVNLQWEEAKGNKEDKKGRGRKGEKWRMEMKSEGRKGNRKQPLKPQLPLDIFRRSFCPYILKILIYGSWLADETKEQTLRKIDPILRKSFSFIICPFSLIQTPPLKWMHCLHSDIWLAAREVQF